MKKILYAAMLLLGVGIMAVSCSKDNANKEIIQWGDDLSGWVTAVYQDGVLLEDVDYAPFDYVLLTWFRSYDGGNRERRKYRKS